MYAKKIAIVLSSITIVTSCIFFVTQEDQIEKKLDIEETEIYYDNNLVIGGTYIRTRRYQEDSLTRLITDTLVILDIKEGYIKFASIDHIEDTSKFWLSRPEKYLKVNMQQRN